MRFEFGGFGSIERHEPEHVDSRSRDPHIGLIIGARIALAHSTSTLTTGAGPVNRLTRFLTVYLRSCQSMTVQGQP